jgi:hypothetical protein
VVGHRPLLAGVLAATAAADAERLSLSQPGFARRAAPGNEPANLWKTLGLADAVGGLTMPAAMSTPDQGDHGPDAADEAAGIGADDLPGLMRWLYDRAIADAQTVADPAVDWDGFVEALWAELDAAFQLTRRNGPDRDQRR